MVASLVAACGDSGHSLSIVLQVDEDTCGAVDSLELSCGTVWLAVRDASGAILSSDCIELPSDRMPLRGLGEVLGQSASLGSLPANEALQIRLALFNAPLVPCPMSGPEPEPVLDGQTRLLVLAKHEGPVPLPLYCAPFETDGGVDQTCSECEGVLEQCLGGLASCEQIETSCQQVCEATGESCESACAVLANRCSDDGEPHRGPMLECEGIGEECTQACKGEPNCEYCSDLESSCMQTDDEIRSCEQSVEFCFQECGTFGSCLSIR